MLVSCCDDSARSLRRTLQITDAEGVTLAAVPPAPQNDTMTTPLTKPLADRQRASTRSGCWATAMVTIFVILFGILMLGQVRGRELSLASFQTRDFTFYRIPVVGWQVTPVWRGDEQGDLADELRRLGLLTAQKPATEWRVAWVRTAGGRHDSDVAILTSYLDDEGEGQGPFWKRWTVDHPQLARRFWPVVQQTAALDAYVLIPELFDLARTATHLNDLTRRLHRFQSRSMEMLADDVQAAGDTRQACAIASGRDGASAGFDGTRTLTTASELRRPTERK